ncbi:MAG: glycosyltransferase family 2 protein [Alphaproteobacteria bacterium]|nr:glycosyltransferase family 2 protein [Alphaproteobacteria bacterium]
MTAAATDVPAADPAAGAPVVTVVVPAFNAAATLPVAVASVRGQSESAWALVVVDDASTDGTHAVAEKMASFERRLTLRSLRENAGRAAARNAGAAGARSEFLAFLDADDAYHPRFIEACVAGLRAHPELDAIKVLPDVPGMTLEPPRLRAVANSLVTNMVVRRAAFEAVGGFPDDPEFRRSSYGGEDIAFMVLLSQRFRHGWIEAPLYRHAWRAGGHLDRFVNRTRIENGKLVHLPPPEGDDEPRRVAAAVQRQLDAYKARLGGR